MRCWWCHNPESQEIGIEQVSVHRFLDGKTFDKKLKIGSWQLAVDVMKEIEKDEVFYLESGGGVTFSGGEPLMQTEELKKLLEKCKQKGYHTAVDTSGYAEPAALKKVIHMADLWLFDLKLMDDSKHVEFTGVSNELALKNLETLANAGKEIVVRFPLIPGITDGIDNLDKICSVMNSLGLNRIDILPYHAIAMNKYTRMGKVFMLEGLKEPGEKDIKTVEDFFTGQGYNVGIGG